MRVPSMRDAAERSLEPRRLDAGMTLIEVLVAMTIFALFAAAFAPIILQGFAIARDNAVQVIANQTAAEVVDAVVVQTSCAGIAARANDWSGGVDAPAGERLTVEVLVDSCPSTFPGTAHVTVRVSGTEVSTVAQTRVFVERA